MKTETIQIQGMSCGHCVSAVRESLEDVEGVRVEDVQIGSARVSYDPEQTGRQDLLEAIEEAGFTPA